MECSNAYCICCTLNPASVTACYRIKPSHTSWAACRSTTTLKSDLTEALKEFNTGKSASLTLGGTLVETPEGMEVDGAGITGWEEVKGDDVNADL